MEVGLYLPVYRRSFRGDNSIFSPWRLLRFVTKLFIYTYVLFFQYNYGANDNRFVQKSMPANCLHYADFENMSDRVFLFLLWVLDLLNTVHCEFNMVLPICMQSN